MKWLAVVLLLVAGAAAAVQPDEILEDPALEARAREVSKGLRCLVCRNESIDESNASLARDLRILLRERILAGDSDEEAVAFIVARYGEYVLLNPLVSGANWLLWGAGPLMLLASGAIGLAFVRGRSKASGPEANALSEEEAARLQEILKR